MSMRTLLLNRMIKLVASQGLEPVARLRTLWPLLLDPPVGQRSHLERIHNGRLMIAVDSPAVAQELQLASRALFERVRRYGLLPEHPEVDAVVSRVVTRPARVEAPRPVKRVTPPPERPLDARVKDALGAVEDEALREQLARLTRRLSRPRREPSGVALPTPAAPPPASPPTGPPVGAPDDPPAGVPGWWEFSDD